MYILLASHAFIFALYNGCIRIGPQIKRIRCFVGGNPTNEEAVGTTCFSQQQELTQSNQIKSNPINKQYPH